MVAEQLKQADDERVGQLFEGRLLGEVLLAIVPAVRRAAVGERPRGPALGPSSARPSPRASARRAA